MEPTPIAVRLGTAGARSIDTPRQSAVDTANATRNGDDTARKVAFLSQPANYAESPATVERIETHMSWVFLAGEHAYKLKKAVHYPFLDFSSASARRRDCLEELRLNRRLAPDAYLGVVPLTREADGRLMVDGHGEPVDWLVRMRRLPRARLLENALAKGAVTDADLDPVIDLLVGFYRAQPPEPLSPEIYRRTLEHEVRANRQVLLEPQYSLAAPAIEALIRAQLDLLRTSPKLFDDRVAAGRIVEGHGDLRPGHIFLGPPPQIIDCLEFNRALRVIDPLDELGYLALECRVRHGETVGHRLLARYLELGNDTAPRPVLAFYQSRRACLRARLCLRHMADVQASGDAAWRDRADAYLELARDYAAVLT